jgi:hypothetical protein
MVGWYLVEIGRVCGTLCMTRQVVNEREIDEHSSHLSSSSGSWSTRRRLPPAVERATRVVRFDVRGEERDRTVTSDLFRWFRECCGHDKFGEVVG